MRLRISLTTAFALVGASALAFTTIDMGGRTPVWAGARCTMHFDPTWAQTHPQFIPEIAAALSVWTNVSGSNMTFVMGGASTASNVRDNNNGSSDFYWGDLGASTYAVTHVVDTGAAIRDRDVEYNTDWNFTTNAIGGPDFRTIAIHELGHVLGLLHETGKPAIMRPYFSQKTQRHELWFDDEEGCRFLYPEPPTPPAPPSDADLVLDSVTYTPLDAGSADDITIEFSLRNIGTEQTGTFSATAYLVEDTDVTPDDRYLGARVLGSLAPGDERTSSVSVSLPDLPEPRLYYIGVILDAQRVTGDPHPENNARVAVQTVQGGGDALEIGPGYRVTGRLIPLGRASFVMELPEGARIDVRAELEHGTLGLSVYSEETGAPLSKLTRFGRARSRLKIPADGRYLVYVDSQNTTVSPYELRVGAKTLRFAGSVHVGDAEQIVLQGYRGAEVTAKIKSQSAVRPEADWLGLEAPVRRNRKGTKVTLRSVVVPATGPLVLGLSNGESLPGMAGYKVRMKIPEKGPVIQR